MNKYKIKKLWSSGNTPYSLKKKCRSKNSGNTPLYIYRSLKENTLSLSLSSYSRRAEVMDPQMPQDSSSRTQKRQNNVVANTIEPGNYLNYLMKTITSKFLVISFSCTYECLAIVEALASSTPPAQQGIHLYSRE